jgi:hypothetical protein
LRLVKRKTFWGEKLHEMKQSASRTARPGRPRPHSALRENEFPPDLGRLPVGRSYHDGPAL